MKSTAATASYVKRNHASYFGILKFTYLIRAITEKINLKV